jgi:PBP1b-binding outer membrane lipoprotein LpoB
MRAPLCVLLCLVGVLGCDPKGVIRDPDKQATDLSGNWNDIDADAVAKEMIGDCLKSGWHARFKAEKGKNPVIRLYRVKNKSAEQINDEYFTKQVERALLNSGGIDVVSAANEGADLAAELADQTRNASDDSVKSAGNAEGADFLLNGAINTQNDAADGKEIRAYVTTMQLTNVASRKKVWIGEKKIRKQINQASIGF